MSALRELLESQTGRIVEEYKQSYSISEIIRNNKFTEGSRRHIEVILKKEGIYEGVGGKSALYKQKKIRNTMRSRYGVNNIGQMPGMGWNLRNNIEKSPIIFLEEMKIYCDLVDTITKKNKKLMISTPYCYYTGIQFVDEVKDKVNPNDQLKRTVDHKISKWVGFICNILPEDIASIGNLVYCLKYCNSLKNNMSEEMFLPFAQKIRELLINEGYKSN